MLFNRSTTEERRRKLHRSYRGAFIGAVFLALVMSAVAISDVASSAPFFKGALFWWVIALIAGIQLWRYTRVPSRVA